MRGRFALRPEIFGGPHDAGAKHRFPKSVHRDAGCQRVVSGDEPLGQRQAVERFPLRQRRESRRDALGYDRSQVLVIAAKLQLRDPLLVGGKFSQDRHGGRRLKLRHLCLGGVQLNQIRPTRQRDHVEGRLHIEPGNRGLLFGAAPLLHDGIAEAQHRRLVRAVRVRRVVQERQEAEVFGLRDRVVLVRVTLGTGHRRAHPHGHRRVDPIDHRDVAELLVAGPAFVVRQGVAVERGRGQLVVRRVRQQVAGELFDRELVERQVAVEGFDDPIAVRPNCARGVVRVPRAVGVPGQVEPHSRPVFPVGWLRQHPID